jgi:hypothetical protein
MTRFFVLDTSDDWTDGEQKAWLTRELGLSVRERGVVWRVAVAHEGATSSGPAGGNASLNKAHIPTLLLTSGISVMLSGNDQIYERGANKSGLRYIVTGGGGAPLGGIIEARRSALVAKSVYHFVEVRVSAEAMRFVARRVDGSVLDDCRLTSESLGWSCDETSVPVSARVAQETPAAAGGGTSLPTHDCACRTTPGRSNAPGRTACALSLASLLFAARRARRLGPTRGRPAHPSRAHRGSGSGR